MFRIGDLVTLTNNAENSNYLEYFGKIGRVIDFHFSIGSARKQYVRVQWSDKQYDDLMAKRFERVLNI